MSSPLDTKGMMSSAERSLMVDGSSSGFDKPDGVYFSETPISSYCFEPHTLVTEDWETYFHGQPVGTIAASDDSSEELNYDQAFSARRQNYFLPSLTSDSDSWMTSAKRRKIDSHTPPSVTRIVTVKATFNNDVIKFNFPVSSGLLNLKNIVAQRLEIKSNRFCLKYIDNEKDLILIAIDEDLKLAIDTTAVNNCFNLICLPDGVCAHELIQPTLEFVADNFSAQIYSSDSKSLLTTGFDDVSEKTHHGKKRKTESDLLPPVTGLVTANITYNKDMKVFQFFISSGLITNLENQVARSFKLKGRKLRLKYWDEDDDLILVACDVDLKLAVVTTGSNNNTIDLICLSD